VIVKCSHETGDELASELASPIPAPSIEEIDMRRQALMIVTLAMALLAPACGDDDSNPDTPALETTTTTSTAPESLTKTPGVLTVGSDVQFPPFENYDETGTIVGFDVDLIQEIADRIGLTVEFVDTDFEVIFTQLATGRYDVVASAASITAQRAQQVTFTRPYFNAQQALTINADVTPGLRSTASLAQGHTVAVQARTTGATWATDNLAPRGVDVREFPTVSDAFNALEAGQVDAVIFDEPDSVAEATRRAGVELVEVIGTNELFAFAVDPAKPELLSQIDAALAAMVADGTYQAIYNRWFVAPGGSVTFQPPPPAAVGSAEFPIQVLYVPSVDPEEIVAGAELLVTALTDATGLSFEVSVPTSYSATVAAMCAAPENTIGFLPAEAYVVAHDLCGVDAALKSRRFGHTEYWTQFIARRDSDIDGFEDLADRTWAHPDTGSPTGFLVPSGMFLASGIEPGERLEAAGQTDVVRAVYNGEVDFGTTFFNPITDLDGNDRWNGEADEADIPFDLIDSCGLTIGGELVCTDVRPRDARRNLRAEAPDVIQIVKIVALSDPVPNDTMSLSPDFPDEVAASIVEAIKAFSTDDPEGFVAAFDAYSWEGVADTNDAEFDSIRALLAALSFDLTDL
jgi:ABC-type amino acid transport substrate-binding protein